MDKKTRRVLWVGDHDRYKFQWITDRLYCICRTEPCDYELYVLRESAVLQYPAVETLSLSVIEDQLHAIIEMAIEQNCDMIVFPAWAKLSDTFFNLLPLGTEVLMEDTCQVPTGQWATHDGVPTLVWRTEFRGWYRVTGVTRNTLDNANSVYTMIREELEVQPEPGI